MEEPYAGLRQEDIENLTKFIAEVNMHRAGHGQSAIVMEDAMRYLRASRFNAAKAIEVYKNYQKNRKTYELDNLRPHREPLSSEIGSKKLRVLGTYDPEGSPLLLFSASKHDKSSDSKGAMQLLFYSLDQVAESEEAQERGVVFIIDMKDCSLTSVDVKYMHNMIVALLEGYPIHMKIIYVVNASILVRGQITILRTLKQQNKMKTVTSSELCHIISPDQLPPSLGGTFSPGHTPSISPRHCLPARRSPDGRRVVRQKSEPMIGVVGEPRGSSGNGKHPKAVNALVGIFEQRAKLPPGGVGGGNGDITHSSSPFQTKSHPPLRPKQPAVFQPRPRSGSSGNGKKDGSPPPVLKKLGFVATKTALKPTGGGGFHGRHQEENEKDDSSKHTVQLRSTGAAPWNRKRDQTEDSNPRPKHPLRPTAPHQKQGGTEKHQLPGNRQPLIPPAILKNKLTQPPAVTSTTPRTSSSVIATTSSSSSSKPNVPTAHGGSIAARIHSFEQQVSDTSTSGISDSKPTAKQSCSIEGKLPSVSEMALLQGKLNQGVSDGGRIPMKPVGGPAKKARVPIKLLKDNIGGRDEHVDAGTSSSSTAAPHAQTVTSEKQESVAAATRVAEERERPKEGKWKKLPPLPSEESQPKSLSSYENVALKGQPAGYENIVIQSPQWGSSNGATGSDADAYENLDFPTPHKPIRQDYENIDILPSSGASAYQGDESSDEEMCLADVEEFSGPPEEVIYENFGPDEGNRAMTPDELAKHVSSRGKQGLSAEYLKIKNEPLGSSYTVCRLPCNVGKNRYKDIVCYDNTRVPLKPLPGIEGSDYIHANFVSGFDKPNAFILTQGPTKKTVVDFWRMVWEYQVFVVVMTTKCVELGKHKCVQYWPDEGNKSFGTISVQVAKTQSCEGYDIRTFKVKCKGMERTVIHYQFLAWPDYGVPDSGTAVIQLVMAVREMQAKHSKFNPPQSTFPPYGPPIVVHCSAGVGRSGTFCTLDYCIDELHAYMKVNVQGVVRRLRLQRAFSIQIDDQYTFCYQTVLEYARTSHKYTHRKIQ